jgi:hypothetical protein
MSKRLAEAKRDAMMGGNGRISKGAGKSAESGFARGFHAECVRILTHLEMVSENYAENMKNADWHG